MAIEIHPRKLRGPWYDGFALDAHTSASTFLGYNAFGHPQFETQRPPIGDLLFRLKNRGDLTAVEPIAEAAAEFLRTWGIKADAMIPVPSSNAARKRQPVLEVANAITAKTGIPICVKCISKVKSTGQLKDIFERAKREKILADAFAVDSAQTQGKRVLVFDDLYRSGATAGAITRLLLDKGAASQVYLLTLTQTRKNL